MATSGPIEDFELVNDFTATNVVDPSTVDSSLRAIAHTINELNTRVHTVANQFDSIYGMSLAAKEMFYQEWGYRPLANLARKATQWYLSPEQHSALFKDAAIHQSVSNLLYKAFTEGTSHLTSNPTVESFVDSLRNIRVALDGLMVPYLNAMENAKNLAEEFGKLPEGLQKAVDSHLAQKGMPQIGGMTGLAITGTQHLGRIPLMLRTLAENASKSVHEGIRDEGEKIQSILNNKIAPAMSRKFSSRA